MSYFFIKLSIIIIIIIILFIGSISFTFAQPRNITVQITNQPNQEIILGTIKGDKFTPIDTTQPFNNTIQFNLPENTAPDFYRIILGQTTYAKIMSEPP